MGEKIASLAFSVLPSEAHPKLDLVEPWSRLLVNSSDFNLNRCRMLFRGLTILTSNLYGTRSNPPVGGVEPGMCLAFVWGGRSLTFIRHRSIISGH